MANELVALQALDFSGEEFELEGGLQNLANNVEVDLDTVPNVSTVTVEHATEVWVHAQEDSFSAFDWYEIYNNCGTKFPLLPASYDPGTSVLLGARGRVAFGYRTPMEPLAKEFSCSLVFECARAWGSDRKSGDVRAKKQVNIAINA